MKLAYLCTQYPLVTHTFIRREIAGVEKRGISVLRIAIRRGALDELPDPDDRDEYLKTYDIVGRGAFALLVDLARAALMHPTAFGRALFKAVSLGWHSNRGLLRHIAYLVEACAVANVIEKHEIQHLHAHFGENAAMVALLAKYVSGVGFSFQVHGPGEFDAPQLIHLPEKVAEATFVTAISDFARSQIMRWADPRHWKKLHVVRCGVDSRFLDEPGSSVPSSPRLVSIGRLSRSKAQPLLLEAVTSLVAEGRRFEVVLIGTGELRGYLETEIARAGIGDTLKLVGSKSGSEVRRELLDCRALLLPSFGEGLPVVIMEAFALGRPVIATRIAGIPELVKHLESGWLISAGNLEELKMAIREALDSSVERLTAMGAMGRATVAERHDSDVEAGKLSALFLGTVNQRSEVSVCA